MADADISPLAEALGFAFYHFERVRPLLPTYGHLLVSSIFPIWIGAHASLARPSSAAKPPKETDAGMDTDDEDSEDAGPVRKMEALGPSDALIFPLTAGFTLGGLYLVINWLEDPALLNKVLSFYFSQMGLFFATAFLKDTSVVVRSFVFPDHYRYWGEVYRVDSGNRIFKAEESGNTRPSPFPGILGAIPLPWAALDMLWSLRNTYYQRLRVRARVRGIFELKTLVGLLDFFSVISALVMVGYFAFVTKPWWLTNFLGFSFSYGALQFMSPSTFTTGSLILASLFFYDIYFVFFTPLMVTVATKLDVPIKLLFPRPAVVGEEQSLAMLGLGDIVIPGMMIGLALRFDLFLYYQRKGVEIAQHDGSKQILKPTYQQATGSWGEKFWTSAVALQNVETEPPYSDARSFPKVYFKASLVGYLFGMVTTLLVMQYSNHAQPALLYLVPGVLLSLWGTALFRGELQTMWEFSDAEDDDDEAESGAKRTQDSEDDCTKTLTEAPKSFFQRIWSGESAVTKEDETHDAAGSRQVKTNTGTKKSGSEGSHRKDSKGDLDLLSFSLSLRRTNRSISDDSTDASEPVMIPESSGGNDDRPLKKRRGVPKASRD